MNLSRHGAHAVTQGLGRLGGVALHPGPGHQGRCVVVSLEDLRGLHEDPPQELLVRLGRGFGCLGSFVHGL